MTIRQYNDDYHAIEADRILGEYKYLLYDNCAGYRLHWCRPDEYELVDSCTFAYKSITGKGNRLARWVDSKDYQEIRHLLTLGPSI